LSLNTSEIMSRIVASGVAEEEALRRLEEKKGELKGLITEEGAAIMVAKDLGIDFFDSSSPSNIDLKIQIKDLKPQMKNVEIAGRMYDIGELREFQKKDGGQGFVLNFRLADSTGSIRVTVWDAGAQALSQQVIENNTLAKLSKAYMRESRNLEDLELHLGNKGRIVLEPADVDPEQFPILEEKELETIEEVPINTGSPFVPINAINSKAKVNVAGTIVSVYPLRTFQRKSGGDGTVQNYKLKDASGEIRMVIWGSKNELQVGDILEVKDIESRFSDYSNSWELHVWKGTTIDVVGTNPHAMPSAVPLANIGPGEFITEGWISSKKPPSYTLTGKVIQSLLINDRGSTQLGITLFGDQISQYANLKIHDRVRVTGFAKEYNNKLQLTLGFSGSIQIIDVNVDDEPIRKTNGSGASFATPISDLSERAYEKLLELYEEEPIGIMELAEALNIEDFTRLQDAMDLLLQKNRILITYEGYAPNLEIGLF